LHLPPDVLQDGATNIHGANGSAEGPSWGNVQPLYEEDNQPFHPESLPERTSLAAAQAGACPQQQYKQPLETPDCPSPGRGQGKDHDDRGQPNAALTAHALKATAATAAHKGCNDLLHATEGSEASVTSDVTSHASAKKKRHKLNKQKRQQAEAHVTAGELV